MEHEDRVDIWDRTERWDREGSERWHRVLSVRTGSWVGTEAEVNAGKQRCLVAPW